MFTRERMVEQLRERRLFCRGESITNSEGAAYLACATERTLQSWRACGIGPPGFYTSRWLYELDEIAAWLNAGGNKRGRGKPHDDEAPGNTQKAAR